MSKEKPETPDERIKRITEDVARAANATFAVQRRISADDVAFLLREIGLRQQALDKALDDVKPGRTFGLEEAAEMCGTVGRRMQLVRASWKEGLSLCKMEQNLKQYAQSLRETRANATPVGP